jgi:Ricin-type beta-trefoil lectin domain
MFARFRTLAVVAAVIGAFVVAVPSPAAANHGGQTLFVNQNSGKCLEIAYWFTHDGALAAQWTCHSGANQQWVYNTSTHLMMNLNSGKCLEVLNSSRADGAPVGQATCTGATNQHWLLNPSNGLVANEFSQKCLEVYGWSTADFASVVQWQCHGGANQIWGWYFR